MDISFIGLFGSLKYDFQGFNTIIAKDSHVLITVTQTIWWFVMWHDNNISIKVNLDGTTLITNGVIIKELSVVIPK